MPTGELHTDQIALLLDQSPDMLGIATHEGFFEWLNDNWERKLGWSVEELCARPYIEFVHPGDVESTLQAASGLAEGQEAVLFVNRYRCKDGTWTWLEWNTRIGPDAKVYFVARDVSIRAQEREQRERMLELLRLGERLSQTGHWSVDLAEQTVFWSPEIYRIHGRSPDSYTPSLEGGIEAYHPDDRDRVAACIKNAVENRESFEFELRLVRESGEIRLVHCVGQPEVDPLSGEVGKVIGVFRDITNDDRTRRTEDLQQFAYMMSHDLQEPLRTIRTFVDLIAENQAADSAGSADAKHRLFVSAAAERLERMIADLLAYTQAGNPLILQPVNLNLVVGEVLEGLADQIARNRAEIEIVARLPTVLGDDARLRLVFQNLISNALKYRGQPIPHVRISAEESGERWRICVADNGIGFENCQSERIFQPFQRLHHRSEFSGTGIGLALVRRGVQQCGGNAWAESSPGEGSRFFLSLGRA